MDLTRRGFLKAAGLAGAAVLLPSRPGRALPADAPSAGVVPTRRLGKTGVDVSILGLGMMFDTIENQIVLRRALQLGVTYWDNADCYEHGNSETGVGKYFERFPEDRKKVFLVSKSDDRDPDGLSRLLDATLKKTRAGHVDLYLVHGIGSIDEVDRPETRAWAEKAKKDGKIRFFGFSAHKNMEDLLLAAARLPFLDAALVTYNYRVMPSPRMREAVEAASKAGLGLIAMKHKGKGPQPVPEAEAMKPVQRFLDQGYTEDQAKMKAVWEDRRVACNLATMGDVAFLESLAAAAMGRTRL